MLGTVICPRWHVCQSKIDRVRAPQFYRQWKWIVTAHMLEWLPSIMSTRPATYDVTAASMLPI